jgi:hypothetical protein
MSESRELGAERATMKGLPEVLARRFAVGDEPKILPPALKPGLKLLTFAIPAARHVSANLQVELSSRENDVYNILWALVFGFATLNILALVARRFETNRRGLSYGEMLAVLVVLVSVVLLGWEMLNLFKIFPIKLSPRQ